MIVKRDMLHQIIEDLPEPQLVELAKFIELLLSGEDKNGIGFELWESEPETGQAESAEDHQVNLDEVIQAESIR
jgi:hypothetical protein